MLNVVEEADRGAIGHAHTLGAPLTPPESIDKGDCCCVFHSKVFV